MDGDGGNQQMLGSDNVYYRARFSPDGTKIVHERRLAGANHEAIITNTNGSRLPVYVTNSSAYDGQPDWSN